MTALELHCKQLPRCPSQKLIGHPLISQGAFCEFIEKNTAHKLGKFSRKKFKKAPNQRKMESDGDFNSDVFSHSDGFNTSPLPKALVSTFLFLSLEQKFRQNPRKSYVTHSYGSC
jgi:hypothetical protein